MQQIVVGGIPQNVAQLPRVQNVSCILTPNHGKGGLYLGNFFGAQNVENLKQYGIRAVLTTSIETPVNYNPQDIPFHKKIAAHDRENFSMIQYLEQCLAFIEQFRALTNVYVHCYAGMSRSTTIVVAYLMRSFKWGYDATLHFVRFKRSIANPNQGFANQLRAYQKTLGIVPKPGFPPVETFKPQEMQQVVRQQIPQQIISNQPPQNMHQNQYPNSEGQRRVTIALPQQLDSRPNVMQNRGPPLQSPRQPQMQPLQSPNMTPRNLPMQVVGDRPQVIGQVKPPMKTKHDQIPIPKFGAKKQVAKQAPSQPQFKPQQPTKAKEQQKLLKGSKAGFIRPKDLPGYRPS